jgi:hypothetical protein
VIKLHEEMGLEVPKVFKKIDGNDYELEVFAREPRFKDHVVHIEEGDSFKYCDH